jgi:hypothetical protein
LHGEALRGERGLEVHILRRDLRQLQGHLGLKEFITMEADEGGRQRGAWARRLEQYSKVIRALLDGGELADGVAIMSSMREAKAALARATTPAVPSTIWKCCVVRGRRPASWMIWHSRLLLASIASIDASGFWSLGLGLE